MRHEYIITAFIGGLIWVSEAKTKWIYRHGQRCAQAASASRQRVKLNLCWACWMAGGSAYPSHAISSAAPVQEQALAPSPQDPHSIENKY